MTLPIFLLAFVLIIEVSRLMWAYITVNAAARQAARYAVTGSVLPEYQADSDGTPANPFNIDSQSPMDRILPCRPVLHTSGSPDPIFDDVDMSEDRYNYRVDQIQTFLDERPGDPGIANLWQPYRSGRECSVEASALRIMLPLPLDVNARPDEPGFYDIVVAGGTDDISPQEGTFRLEDDSVRAYSTYFPDSPFYNGEGTVNAFCYDP
ncbi:MAG: hypothetical protein GYB64_12200, partial [Chloroflexi bacterium]|nr:hypothetical protein [Chloroflexota bacterium]